VKGSNPHIRNKTIIYNYILVAKDKLHTTLVANVDEVNIKQNISQSVYYCTIPFIYYHKINNLHNDMWQM
jgi:hypothetical protein